MTLRKWRFAITSLIILALALSHICAAEDQILRVGLVRSYRGVKQITVLASSNFTILEAGSSDKLVTCTNLEPITLNVKDGNITLTRADGKCMNIGTSIVVAPNDPLGTISVDSPSRLSKQYRGRLEVTLKSGLLQLVNIIGVEDYLPGVIASEMPSSYPDEALRAQAVAARNFSISGLGRHKTSRYDLCDDSHCQVYDGMLREKPSCTRAVLSTKGQVLTYNSQIASVMYCADCGGVTEYCGKSTLPYLASVTEPAGVSHNVWEKSYKLEELSSKLVAAGAKEADGLKKLVITKTSPSGRVQFVDIAGAKSSTTISGAKLRLLLGLDTIRSTLFTIESTSDSTITFKGKGYGHGIGLCQVGAKALADAPFNYTFSQILAHYYPGTTLTAASGVIPSSPMKSAKVETHRKGSTLIDVRVVEPTL